MSTSIADIPDESQAQLHRVAVYVDGLNLYHGLKSRRWRRYYWLNLRRLAERLLRPDQSLVMVRYFTARFLPHFGDPDQPLRQDTYLKALETLPDLTIQYGHHLPKTGRCRRCGATWATFEEKMTDVNIAVALLRDAMRNTFDTAIVISADSDLTSPINTVLHSYPEKRVVIAFPPNRHSEHLHHQATATIRLGRSIIANSQFPPQVTDANGFVLHKPSRWN